jgi:hypothetical protein
MSISAAKITHIFKDTLYSQPIFVRKMPPRDLVVTIRSEENIQITQNKPKESKDITLQRRVPFYPFFLQTKTKLFLLVGLAFSLYENINHDPYLETKAEYQFQQGIKKALGLAGGYSYYLPGDSSDFITKDVSLEDVYSQDLSLRYENDGQYSYLFILL